MSPPAIGKRSPRLRFGAVGPWQIEQWATALKTYSPWAITAGSVDATIAGRAIAE